LGQDWYRLPALTLPAPLRGQNRKTVGMLYLWFEVENVFELEFEVWMVDVGWYMRCESVCDPPLAMDDQRERRRLERESLEEY
jgi:hypothetical protein